MIRLLEVNKKNMDEIINNVKDMAEGAATKVNDVVGNVFGVDSEMVEILKAKYDELMADGKISKDEVFSALEEFAKEKGISTEILEKAKSLFGVSSDTVSAEPVDAAAAQAVESSESTV